MSTHPSNKVTLENVADVIHYHKPTEKQAKTHEDLSFATERLLETILKLVPDCADRSTAIRCVREAKMWASAAVALEMLEKP